MKFKRKIKAITLKRPWSWAIAHSTKRIENRTWNCYLEVGDYLAIHAGKGWDNSAIPFMRNCMNLNCPESKKDHPTGIVAIARFSGNITESDDPWFMGPIGWQLDNVISIEPVPCSGMQGLWAFKDDVLQQCRDRYKESLISHRQRDPVVASATGMIPTFFSCQGD